MASAEWRRDSLKNWRMSWPRVPPSVFRRPTSFARPSKRAVARFMKLTQAMRQDEDGDEGKNADVAHPPSVPSGL